MSHPLYFSGPKWPCKLCGSRIAPAWNIDQDGQVEGCSNCRALALKQHLAGPDEAFCWCEPTLTYRNPKTGECTYVHVPLQ